MRHVSPILHSSGNIMLGVSNLRDCEACHCKELQVRLKVRNMTGAVRLTAIPADRYPVRLAYKRSFNTTTISRPLGSSNVHLLPQLSPVAPTTLVLVGRSLIISRFEPRRGVVPLVQWRAHWTRSSPKCHTIGHTFNLSRCLISKWQTCQALPSSKSRGRISGPPSKLPASHWEAYQTDSRNRKLKQLHLRANRRRHTPILTVAATERKIGSVSKPFIHTR